MLFWNSFFFKAKESDVDLELPIFATPKKKASEIDSSQIVSSKKKRRKSEEQEDRLKARTLFSNEVIISCRKSLKNKKNHTKNSIQKLTKRD